MIEQDKAVLEDDALDYKVMALRNDLRTNTPLCAESLARDLHFLRAQVIVALGKRRFVWIPSPNDAYLNTVKPFGESVHEKLPEARIDIESASNSLAVDLGTAAVFHLIRASEYGLRAIATVLGVQLTDRGQPQPLEYGDWNKIITQCKNKIEDVRKLTSGPIKDAQLQLYSGLADQSEYIKDLWRNDICHTRKYYSFTDGVGVFERIKNFLQAVCGQLP
jgi:hypothetical protein